MHVLATLFCHNFPREFPPFTLRRVMRTLTQSNAMQSRILLFVSKITSRAVLDMQKMCCVLSRSAMSKVSSENKESIINKVQQHKFGLKLTEQLFTSSNISMHVLHTVL